MVLSHSLTDLTFKSMQNNVTHPLRIAINGFGRIGRNVLRCMIERGLFFDDSHHLELVAINDVADPQSLLHLLQYDSTHGRLSQYGYQATIINQDDKVELRLHKTEELDGDDHLVRIELLTMLNPTQLPWQDLDIDLVLECSGHFRSYTDASQHCNAGAKQVIIGAAPFDEVDASIVMGVNDNLLNRQLPIISSVSCTTQALVPLISVLDDAFGVCSAMMTEIHAVTADQNVLDQAHRDLRRARAAGYNIIPTTSSSIAATQRVLPKMIGRINGHSIRVPTMDVAAIDVNFIFEKAPNIDTVNQLLQQVSTEKLAGVMGYSEEPLVSSDFIHQSESLVIDGLQTMQVGNQYKVFAWYDNEWGYANRLLDMCLVLASLPS